MTWLLQRLALFSVILAAFSAENATAQFRPFINISTRAEVLGGQNIIVAGFIIQTTTSSTKKVLVRGMGPSYGLSLADPTITLHGPNGVIHTNNNWKETQESAIQATGFQPGNDLESAILWDLPAGSYTVTLGAGNGGTGIGLVELYDMGGAPPIVNLSSRARVGTGDNALIAGVYVGDSTRAVVRAIGPSLANHGIEGALANPTLELYNGQGTLAYNDDWGTDGAAGEIQSLGLQPTNPSESAILPTLAPGPYTVVVRGLYNTTGIGMAELYALEDAKYPRIFAAWANASAVPGEDATTTLARHDLVWMGPGAFGWWWTNPADHSFWDYRSENLEFFPEWTEHPIATLRSRNPNIKILAVLQHYSLYDGELPIDHDWWLRQGGQPYPAPRIQAPFPGTPAYLLNQKRSDLKTHITSQAISIMQSGQFDGLFLDHFWPLQDAYGAYTQNDLQAIIDNLRAALPNALIVVNANENPLPLPILNKVNGVFMESNQMTSTSDWTAVKTALLRNEANAKTPRANCLETTGARTDPPNPRMRATTCLSLIFSDGYALFSDVGNHEHSWYSFWSDHSLGRATSNSYSRGNAFARDFQNGTAVWNNTTGSVQVTFGETRTSLRTGTPGTIFSVPATDGDIFIK